MMEWKTLGIIMIVPTVSVALVIAFKTWRQTEEFWINAAICFWITANAFWMCCEFFNHAELKLYAGIPFALGILCTLWFYLSKKPGA